MSEGNELMVHWVLPIPIPSIMMSPQQARYFTKKYLGPLLESSGFGNVKLFALDDQRPFMLWYFDRVSISFRRFSLACLNDMQFVSFHQW
jgi:hypothetical protein